MAMKKQIIPCALLSACLMLGAGAAAMAETPSAGPNLVAHYTFADENNVGKDSAGTADMKVYGKDAVTEAEAKVVEGPVSGMKALQFDQTYALATAKSDVTDTLKEFTVTFLVAADENDVLKYNMFSTGLGNINDPKHSGINVLMDLNGKNYWPEVRLYGGEQGPTANDGAKWATDQFKNDDGAVGKANWADREKKAYVKNEWYRLVITVKLSDGTNKGLQSCYIEKVGAVDEKADFVDHKNYYESELPVNLSSVKNDNYGISLGACYAWTGNQSAFYAENGKNYGMFQGLMADVRIYDKALTQDQIVELYQNNQLSTDVEGTTSEESTESTTSTTSTVSNTSTESKAPQSTASAPPTGVAGNLLPLLVLIPAAGVAGVLVVRRKGKASK